MKRIGIIFLLTLLCLGMSLCISSHEEEKGEWITYKNLFYNYSLDQPSSWKKLWSMKGL
jgi:hypothetical protein